jgi:hypothetical protein
VSTAREMIRELIPQYLIHATENAEWRANMKRVTGNGEPSAAGLGLYAYLETPIEWRHAFNEAVCEAAEVPYGDRWYRNDAVYRAQWNEVLTRIIEEEWAGS